MTGLPPSRRAKALASIPSLQRIQSFMGNSTYSRRQHVPGICDFTLGNPHQMPQDAYVDALRDALTPRNDQWFAYKANGEEARAAAAESLHRLLDVPFDPRDLYLTTGGFTAIALALKAVADPGDEVIYSLPPWFLYEPLVVEAGLVPVKVRINLETFDLDLEAIAAAVTARTRVVIINSPNNPTGRIYAPELLQRLARLLEDASARNGRRIYLVSDEPYNRIVFDGTRFHSPTEFYPHTLLAYSYGKTHLAPGERIGYLALPPTMPERKELREEISALQLAMGWIYPNAVLQYALPRLEQFSIDVGQLQRKRDRLVEALGSMGYRLRPAEGTFYLFVHSPIADDEAFTESLSRHDVFVLPGVLFETPGFFRVSLTASEDMVEHSLPVFAAAIEREGV
ncbi:Aspartate aminotransferase [Arthrobacter sp. Bi83]|uniref:aminotransferase class I/II-fold pyridoxal phosphate-dependent enzyme n=1 Tax=Arthrobacter sp. Bi83 TaxID=2822353 RepID=UPI001DDEF28D|nr:aminotransferase class I/II-fold pyridoxal phosphate-dependent enzyme [Arthrobacter sp. Bi83]CAH0224122.1 Aspartate aminotransferase [Arthrobacter sp. Bi83]